MILVPQRACSYRCAFSEPRVQYDLYFSPSSGVIGQVGQMHPFSSEMHMKLFPVAQNSSSFAFFAQPVYVGQVGQVHMAEKFLTASFIAAGDIPFIACIFSSNLSIISPFLFLNIHTVPVTAPDRL